MAEKDDPKCPKGCKAPIAHLAGNDAVRRYQCGNIDCLHEWAVSRGAPLEKPKGHLEIVEEQIMARQKAKGRSAGKLECRYGCGKTFGSETWKEKHEEDKCHLRPEARERTQFSRAENQPRKQSPAAAIEDAGDRSVEETPDLPNTPITETTSTRGQEALNGGGLAEIVKTLEEKREYLIANNPEIRKLDIAIKALKAQ